MLFAELIAYMESDTKLDAKELTVEQLIGEIKDYLTPVLSFVSTAHDADFEKLFKVPFGSGGPIQYYYRLCDLVRKNLSDFCPDGYKDWEASQSEEKIRIADQQVKKLTSSIQGYIFDMFKKLYGEKDNAYWERGVTDKEMKTNAYKKSLDDDPEKRLAIEAYLDIIQLKKIVENRKNWLHFKDVFNIPLLGEKGLAKNIKWMEILNEVRRIAAHSYQRTYRASDFDFLDWLIQEWFKRIDEAKQKATGNDGMEYS